MKLTRRGLLAASAGLLAMPHVARAATVVDAAGRSVTVPERVERVFPAGPPAAITHYTLQPRTLLGWPRANRPAELAFLDPEVGARPELGRLTGRGNTTNLEVLLQLKPDLILDMGSTARTFVETADRVQEQTRKVMRQIRALTAQGLGVLFTTHDPNQALRYADRVALLAEGQLKRTGPPGEILTPSALEELYGAPVESIGDAGKTAFLPA
jgi:hypothetical protein